MLGHYGTSHIPPPQIRNDSSLEESIVITNGYNWNLCDPVSSYQKFQLLGAPVCGTGLQRLPER